WRPIPYEREQRRMQGDEGRHEEVGAVDGRNEGAVGDGAREREEERYVGWPEHHDETGEEREPPDGMRDRKGAHVMHAEPPRQKAVERDVAVDDGGDDASSA